MQQSIWNNNLNALNYYLIPFPAPNPSNFHTITHVISHLRPSTPSHPRSRFVFVCSAALSAPFRFALRSAIHVASRPRRVSGSGTEVCHTRPPGPPGPRSWVMVVCTVKRPMRLADCVSPSLTTVDGQNPAPLCAHFSCCPRSPLLTLGPPQ